MIFFRQNFILNSNFAAHRWRCKHQNYLDTLFLLELRLMSAEGKNGKHIFLGKLLHVKLRGATGASPIPFLHIIISNLPWVFLLSSR